MKNTTKTSRPPFDSQVRTLFGLPEKPAKPTPTAQHTPGPWEVQRDDSVETYRIWGEPNRDRHLIVCSLGAESKCAIANARLIAAAPDLLAALDDFTQAVWSDCRLPLEMRSDLAALYHNSARAAIAKARA